MGLLVNTLASDGKYPVFNRENLRIAIHMQLGQKQRTFFEFFFFAFFAAFFKSTLSFEYLERKDDPHSFSISEVTDS